MPPATTMKWALCFTKATKAISIGCLGVMYSVIGVRHFTDPDYFMTIMPPKLPFARLLVFFTGGWEIVNGVLLLIHKTRKLAALSTTILLIAVFPANIYLVLSEVPQQALDITQAQAIQRIPFQLTLFFLAIWHARPDNKFAVSVCASIIFYPTIGYFLSLL